MAIINHIENQGSSARNCYERLEVNNQQDVINHIATYAIALVVGLKSIKAERDGDNRVSEKDAPPVLPVQIVKLCVASS